MCACKMLLNKIKVRLYSSTSKHIRSTIDWDYFSNPSNFKTIASNILSRKVYCDYNSIFEQLRALNESKDDLEKSKNLRDELAPKLIWFPNSTHPRVSGNKSGEPVVIKKVGIKPPFAYFPASFESLTKRLNVLRTKNLGQMCGSKSYFLKNDLALLEQSLVRYAVSKLTRKGFQLISVPDILPKQSFEACGMKTENKHSQVYNLHDEWGPNLYLSGTSEIALASYLAGKTFDQRQLPLKFCAVSRCYRAEANKHQKEKGIFRVHFFTKVEMFGITGNEVGDESEMLLDEFVELQNDLFTELGLHFKIIEMPPNELGLPAYHKIDMEAWIPTQKIYGEISSASNCTDYQSRRLDIKYNKDNDSSFCHTVNGTACAIPRMLIAILENFQNLDGSIQVPIPLRRFMKKDTIGGKFKEIMLCTRPIP